MDQSELNCLDAWRSRTDERGDVIGDGVPTGDGSERDVLVDRVVSEERRQFDCADVVGPRSAEPTHYIDRTLHMASPSTRLRPSESSAESPKTGSILGQNPNGPVRKVEKSAKREYPGLHLSPLRFAGVVHPRRRQSGWLLRRWMVLRKLPAVGPRNLRRRRQPLARTSHRVARGGRSPRNPWRKSPAPRSSPLLRKERAQGRVPPSRARLLLYWRSRHPTLARQPRRAS